MKNFKTAFLLFSLFIITLLCSCGSVNLKDDQEVADFLREHDLQLEGDWNFYRDGTFELKPASPNDPIQLYKGRWSLGKYWECEVEGCDLNPTREITISFVTKGWVTDGHYFNGTNFSGIGKKLEGTISKSSYGKWFVTFKDNNYTGGWVVDANGETQLSGKSSFQCDLTEKPSDKISTKESAGIATNTTESDEEIIKAAEEAAATAQPTMSNDTAVVSPQESNPNDTSAIVQDSLISGTNKYCDTEGYWYAVVIIEGINITIKKYAGEKNTAFQEKTLPKDIIKGEIVKGNVILTKNEEGELAQLYKISQGILYESGYEGTQNLYQKCN